MSEQYSGINAGRKARKAGTGKPSAAKLRASADKNQKDKNLPF